MKLEQMGMNRHLSIESFALLDGYEVLPTLIMRFDVHCHVGFSPGGIESQVMKHVRSKIRLRKLIMCDCIWLLFLLFASYVVMRGCIY